MISGNSKRIQRRDVQKKLGPDRVGRKAPTMSVQGVEHHCQQPDDDSKGGHDSANTKGSLSATASDIQPSHRPSCKTVPICRNSA